VTPSPRSAGEKVGMRVRPGTALSQPSPRFAGRGAEMRGLSAGRPLNVYARKGSAGRYVRPQSGVVIRDNHSARSKQLTLIAYARRVVLGPIEQELLAT